MDYYKSPEYFKSLEYKYFRNKVDTLDGNISRICVTDDLDECRINYDCAVEKLKWIYEYRCKVLSEGKKI